MSGMNDRTGLILGEEGLERLREAHIVLAGAGAVGGYALEGLVRAGVGHIRVVDADVFSESNLNRQILATVDTIGRPKSEVACERARSINPDVDIEGLPLLVSEETIPEILDSCEVLVDAIDTLSPKMSLIKYCMDRNIPLVSSMGAGAKTDATRVRIADISKSYNCPLAFVVRKRLRRMGIKKGFKVVFSEELPMRSAIVECDDRNRKSLVGSISYMPAVFGCVCAQAAIAHLLE